MKELASLGGGAEYWAADIGSAERSGAAAVVGRRAFRHAARAGQQRRPRASRSRRSACGYRRQLRGSAADESAGPVLSDAGGCAAVRAVSRTPDGAPRAIVFVTSVSAEMASPHRGEYCVSKAGLSMAAKLFAVRLAPERIPVYEVRPGIIATDMTAGVKDMYDKRIAEGLVPEGALGTARRRRARGRFAASRRHRVRNRHRLQRRRWFVHSALMTVAS